MPVAQRCRPAPSISRNPCRHRRPIRGNSRSMDVSRTHPRGPGSLTLDTSHSQTPVDGRAVSSWYTPGFTDALGDRLLLFDNTDGGNLEMLRLRTHLTIAPRFAACLRDQHRVLTSFV